MKRSLLTIAVLLLISLNILAQEAANPLLASWPQYLEHKANTPFKLKWISLGPVINSARVDAVQCDPSKPGTWYAGFGSGNLWKTTDHGLSWKPIFEDQSALSIGDFTFLTSTVYYYTMSGLGSHLGLLQTYINPLCLFLRQITRVYFLLRR